MLKQISVMGSAADLGYAQAVEEFAKEVGREVAKAGYALMFGAEKDCTSLSTTAALAAKLAGGITVGFTYGKGFDVFVPEAATIVVPTGLERGGGREFVVGISGQVLIAIAGGSGTVNEMAVAYQASIPIVGIVGFGGWSEQMAGKAFDVRRPHLAVKAATTAKQAIELALQAIGKGASA